SMRLSRILEWLLLVSLFTWVDGQDHNSFNDATSKQIWTLAYWTTSANPQVCVPKKNPGWAVLSVIQAPGAPMYGQALAVVSVSETLKMVHVHFRGPDSVTTFIFSGFQMLMQPNFPVESFEGFSAAVDNAKTFTALWQGGLRAALNSAWDEYCDFPILVAHFTILAVTHAFFQITGNSVGGCPAQMLAIKLKKLGMWDRSAISLYLYSSPRCGYQVPLSEYVINLPATTCTSIDAANPQQCYWHAGYAIQYSKNIFGMTSGTIARCANGEITTCLAGSILNIGNHNGFYGLTYGFAPPTC
ncbi:hypothetical protein PFISCL1PPCAC_27515, partial [Pristionchus fissidentatus]